VNQALQGASEALEPKCLTGRPEHFTDRAGFGPGQKKTEFFGPRKSFPRPSHGTCWASVFGPGLGRVRAWAGCLRILHGRITNNSILGRTRAEKNFAGFKISAHARPVTVCLVGEPQERSRADPLPRLFGRGAVGAERLQREYTL
jgi:hypothetical protein